MKEYNIHKRFNYYINNNIINNNKSLKFLDQYLYNNKYIEFDINQYQLYYFIHEI